MCIILQTRRPRNEQHSWQWVQSSQFRALRSSHRIPPVCALTYRSAEMDDPNRRRSSVSAAPNAWPARGSDVGLQGVDIESALRAVEDREKDFAEKLELNPDLAQRGPSDVAHGPAYREIRNLVLAKKDPVYSVALEEWDRKERLVSSRVDRREKRSADLINQIFNLVGFYSVFQGVVLTAVSQVVSAASSCGSQCGKVWVPILLTLFAAVVTIVGILQKFTNLNKLETSIFEERRIQAEAVRRGEGVRTRGEDFRFQVYEPLPYATPKSFWKNRFAVIASLLLFTGIFILAYFNILCNFWEIKSWKGGLR